MSQIWNAAVALQSITRWTPHPHFANIILSLLPITVIHKESKNCFSGNYLLTTLIVSFGIKIC